MIGLWADVKKSLELKILQWYKWGLMDHSGVKKARMPIEICTIAHEISEWNVARDNP